MFARSLCSMVSRENAMVAFRALKQLYNRSSTDRTR